MPRLPRLSRRDRSGRGGVRLAVRAAGVPLVLGIGFGLDGHVTSAAAATAAGAPAGVRAAGPALGTTDATLDSAKPLDPVPAGDLGTPESRHRALAAETRAALATVLERIADRGPGASAVQLGAAITQLDALLARVVAWGDLRDRSLLRDVALTRRLLWLANGAPADAQAQLLREFIATPELASAVAFTVRPEVEDAPKVARVLVDLLRAMPDAVRAHPQLAAALAVVHDERNRHRVNENVATSAPVTDLMRYYVTNARHMYYGLTDVPAPLLVYVVDTTASIDDMEWALGRYAGQGDVGERFFEIDYDFQHAATGRPKRVTQEGFSLENIERYGGVCADQAYFAAGVAKAIGIPATYTSGRSAEVSHAWVGYVARDRRGGPYWDFNAGRYEAYQGVQGAVVDPQVRRIVPDSIVSMLTMFAAAPQADREFAIACADAARAIAALESPKDFAALAGPRPVPASGGDADGDAATAEHPGARSPRRDRARGSDRDRTRNGSRDRDRERDRDQDRSRDQSREANDPATSLLAPETARPASVATRLTLLRAGLEACPATVSAWDQVGIIAGEGAMSLDDKRAWADAAWRLCGERFPDLFVDVVEPMITTVDDLQEQQKLWRAVGERVSRRRDLAAACLMKEARMWLDAGETDAAGRCCELVIQRHVNDGPFAIAALRMAEQLLVDARDGDGLMKLYQRAWNQAERPQGRFARQFAMQSNWYRIGYRYAWWLSRGGDQRLANRVHAELERVIGG